MGVANLRAGTPLSCPPAAGWPAPRSGIGGAREDVAAEEREYKDRQVVVEAAVAGNEGNAVVLVELTGARSRQRSWAAIEVAHLF